MASETTGAKDQPYFSSTGAPQIDVDPGLVSDYAALVGNHKQGTNAERVALSGKKLWVGLGFYETDTDTNWRYKAAGWVRLPVISWGVASATTDANGFITVTHGMPVTPTMVVPGIADDTPAIGNLLKVNYRNITATTFQLRFYRSDTNASFNTNPVKASWVAIG